jgi:hypothetical protein
MKFVSWRVSALSIVCALALQACGGGGGGKSDPVATPQGQASNLSTASGTPVVMGAAGGGVLSIDNSAARFSLPANALVNATTLQAVSGDVTVKLDVIDTRAVPADMLGGGYEALIDPATGETGLIENFGLIDLTLSQGRTLLQLAKGQTASIRIPLLTRSAERPTSLPLYRWDDDQGLWVQDGQAQLNQKDPAKPFYEGEATRLTAWSVNQPIADTVTVEGCVEATPGAAAAEGDFEVYTEGWNYTGLAWASKSGNTFSLPTKKGGQIKLHVVYRGKDIEVLSATADADITLPQCILATSNYQTLRDLEALRAHLEAGLGMAYDAIFIIDPNTLTLRDPNGRCQSGSLGSVTLGGKPVVPGQVLQPDTPYLVATTFNQCRPQPEPGEDPAGITAVLQGRTLANFFTTTSDTGYDSTTLLSTLTGLEDAGLQLGNTGGYKVSYAADIGTQITPTPDVTTLHNLSSGNTLTFTGGFVTRSPTAFQGASTFHNLSYTLGGHTYTLNGTAAVGQSLRLSKDGIEVAVMTPNGSSVQASGTVDPF